ncbi:MAG TPA: dihydroorotate dehydrogenase [Caldisericia bacterium]|nr:dihydroorotate dehydrogenase [Caldisericia bacterium]HPF48212.1 dihydroorotate dehydrogenase [Caldisericia bacterium]HPI83852.1 dihydroorotate dehydrogenase [Caldisericia bacterium]HPQ92665.1 dihydroorotate dehydrogenase [Caldisericia bacterium]HRV74237.1 dihydroorotate dehydrogenase [Caldisericia bacterium]
MPFSPATIFCGEEYTNPVLAASGTFGCGEVYCDILDYSKIGGFFTKAVTAQAKAGNPGQRLVETSGGLLNSIGLENEGLSNFIEKKLPAFEDYKCHVWVNVSGSSQEEYINIIDTIGDHPSIAGFELNVSCPNVKKGGMSFGSSESNVRSLTSKIRVRTKKPIVVKLSPNVTDIVEIAQAAKDSKANAVTVANTFLGMEIDVNKRKPVLGNITGGYSGEAIFPMALRCVWQVYSKVDIPIIGCGGINTGLDAIKFLMAGASMVQVGTANFKNPNVMVDIAQEMETWARQNGFSDFREIVGVAHEK